LSCKHGTTWLEAFEAGGSEGCDVYKPTIGRMINRLTVGLGYRLTEKYKLNAYE